MTRYKRGKCTYGGPLTTSDELISICCLPNGAPKLSTISRFYSHIKTIIDHRMHRPTFLPLASTCNYASSSTTWGQPIDPANVSGNRWTSHTSYRDPAWTVVILFGTMYLLRFPPGKKNKKMKPNKGGKKKKKNSSFHAMCCPPTLVAICPSPCCPGKKKEL